MHAPDKGHGLLHILRDVFLTARRHRTKFAGLAVSGFVEQPPDDLGTSSCRHGIQRMSERRPPLERLFESRKHGLLAVAVVNHHVSLRGINEILDVVGRAAGDGQDRMDVAASGKLQGVESD